MQVLGKEPNPEIENLTNFKGALNQESFKAVKNLHINWYIHSVKALMGQLGKQLYKKLNKGGRKRLLKCLNNIEDERELVYGAKCLSQARKLIQKNRIPMDNNDIAFLQETASKLEVVVAEGKKAEQNSVTAPFPTANSKSINSNDYQFFTAWKKPELVQPQLNNNVKAVNLSPKFRHQTRLDHFNDEIAEIQNKRLRQWRKDGKGTIKLNLSGFFTEKKNTGINKEYGKQETALKYQSKRSTKPEMQVIKMDKLDSLQTPKSERTPLQKMARLIWTVTNGDEKKTDWADTYAKLLRFKKSMEDRRKLPGAKIYDHRLYDIVSNRKKPSMSTKDSKPFPDFYTMTYKLVDALKGTKSGTEGTNIKLLSPRLAPLMPDKIPSTRRLLSPSFFSFYKDDSPDNIASIPNILEKIGLPEEDKNVVMDLVMSFSGAGTAINKTLETLRQINFFGLENEFFEVTKSLNGLFKKVEKSFNKGQQSDIDLKGYTFLEKHQIEDLIRGHSQKLKNITDPEDIGFDLERYGSLNKQQKYEALWDRIEQIAQNKSAIRTKRQIMSPVVLAPYMFAPIIGITVLGPVVLSPSLFSPLIFNPACLSPYVLSPGVGMPFILSPYVLSPYVLTPLALAPFVFSPYALSPNVITPYVLSPIVLSPYVLSPDLLSPATLGGPVLSPNAFSPAVFTDTVLMADVLSPTFMS